MTVDITFKIQRMGEDAPDVPIKIRLLQPNAYLPDASVPRYDYETVTDSLGEATITVDTPGTGFSWPFSCSVDNKDTCSFPLGDDNGPTITWRYIQENLCGLGPIPPSPPIYIPVITPATTGNLVQQTADGALEDGEAPTDTTLYGRIDAAWAEAETPASAQTKADAAQAASISYSNQQIISAFEDMTLLAWYESRYTQLDEGAPVPSLYDMSGNGYHLVNSTESQRPLYQVASDGQPYISFDGIDDYLRVATNPAPTQEYTVFLLFRYRDEYVGSSTVFDGAGGVNSGRLFRPASRQFTFYAGASLISSLNSELAWGIYRIKSDGANSEIESNQDTTTGNAGTAAPVGLTIGAYGLTPPSDFSGIDFRALIVFDGVLTSAQQKKVRLYLRTIAGIPIVFVGDSITLGTGATGFNGFAQLYSKDNGTVVSPYNLGVGGKLMAGMRDDAASQAQAYTDQTNANSTVVIYGGTNDIVGGETPEDTHAALKQCCLIWKAQGFKVAVINMLPRTGFSAERATYNGLISANYTEYADALADVAADTRIGQDGDNTDPTYYDVDQVHPNDAGHAIIESYVSAAITWI